MPDLDPAPILEALATDPQLRVFLGDGRIETMPAKQSRRRLLLDQVAQAFEPGKRYSEQQVSAFLAELHPDYAALRRYLVDEGFLSRSHGEYWRSGGSTAGSGDSRGNPTISHFRWPLRLLRLRVLAGDEAGGAVAREVVPRPASVTGPGVAAIPSACRLDLRSSGTPRPD